MGKMRKKRRGASWLSVVKRVFQCSPTDNEEDENVKTGTKQDDHSQEEKEKLMQRWVMEAPTKIQVQQCPKSKTAAGNAVTGMQDLKGRPSQQRQAFAAAVSTAANAAEAATATARAAVDIARLATRPSGKLIKRQQAATIIQKAFRGYLARRALRALKGLVKLQALIRGQNARKQTEMALNCIKALLQVKNGHLCDQRARVSMSHEGSRSSMLSETNNLWESAYLQDIEHRLSTSRRDCFDKSGRKEAALRREKALAYAFSNQIWRTGRHSSFGDQRELQERTRWFDRWMATKQLEHSSRRASIDRSGPINSVETDPFKKPCSPCCATINTRPLKPQTGFSPQCCTPPNRRPCYSSLQQSPLTPPFSIAMPLHVCTDSPHYYRTEKSHSTAHSPCLGDGYPLDRNSIANATTPNYMAATESAKARVRSLSTPRQWPLVPERGRGGSIRKRLSYPAVPISELDGGRGNGGYCTVQELRSPSLKSFHGERYEADQHSSTFSYLDRMGREISPASTTDLRLWLR